MRFERAYEQYKPMIFAIIRKLNIYKDYDDYFQIGCIAIWHACESFLYQNNFRNRYKLFGVEAATSAGIARVEYPLFSRLAKSVGHNGEQRFRRN